MNLSNKSLPPAKKACPELAVARSVACPEPCRMGRRGSRRGEASKSQSHSPQPQIQSFIILYSLLVPRVSVGVRYQRFAKGESDIPPMSVLYLLPSYLHHTFNPRPFAWIRHFDLNHPRWGESGRVGLAPPISLYSEPPTAARGPDSHSTIPLPLAAAMVFPSGLKAIPKPGWCRVISSAPVTASHTLTTPN